MTKKINHYFIRDRCYLYQVTRVSLGPCKDLKKYNKDCPHKAKEAKANSRKKK